MINWLISGNFVLLWILYTVTVTVLKYWDSVEQEPLHLSSKNFEKSANELISILIIGKTDVTSSSEKTSSVLFQLEITDLQN